MMRLWECVSAEYGLSRSLQGIFGTKTLAALSMYKIGAGDACPAKECCKEYELLKGSGQEGNWPVMVS